MSKPEKTTTTTQVVTFEVSGDGMAPREAPWGFVLRNPLGLVVPPKMTSKIDLKVSCRHPVMAFPTRSHQDDVTPDRTIFHPGDQITVTVKNTSEHLPLMIESGEAILNLHPLVYSGTAEVKR